MRPVDLATLRSVIEARVPPGSGVDERRLASSISIDSRAVQRGGVFFAMSGEHTDGHRFCRKAVEAGAVACVVEKPVSGRGVPALLVDDSLDALERLARWHRHSWPLDTTGITGSVGKTTTKDFLRALLAAQGERVEAARNSFNNRLGVALTLLAPDERTERLVVELGTSGHGEIRHLSALARPDRAVLTAIAPAHLSGLRDLGGVVEAKAEILEGMVPGAPVYLPDDVPGKEVFVRRAPGPVRTFGLERGDFAVRDVRLRAEGGYGFSIDGEELALPLPGRHNILNAASAVAVCRDLGFEWEQIRGALLGCALPPRRLECRIARGLTILDDSYNANPGSVASALDVLVGEGSGSGGRCVAVLGDMLELGPDSRRYHEELGERAAAAGVDLLVTLGEASRFIELAFRRAAAGSSADTAHFDDVRAACEFLIGRLAAGDRVLLKGSNRSGVGELASRLRSELESTSTAEGAA